MKEEERQEREAQKVVDKASTLEMVLLGYFVAQYKKVLENGSNEAVALSTLRNMIRNSVNDLLPQIEETAEQVLNNNARDTVEGYNPTTGVNEYVDIIRNRFREYINTQGTNFVIGRQGFLQYFTTLVESTVEQVVGGNITVAQAVDTAVQQLAKSGLRVIDYNSGIARQLDVWARQEMLYAQKESSQDIRRQYAQENDITIFEFDAHANARPSHQVWQGKRYDLTGTYYPTLEELTHGEHEDYGCKHRAYPVHDKDDKYMLTPQQIDAMNTKPFEYRGTQYDGYEATQRQRRYERDIRRLKKERALLQQVEGDTSQVEARLKKEQRRYREFCTAFGTYPRSDRTKIHTLK